LRRREADEIPDDTLHRLTTLAAELVPGGTAAAVTIAMSSGALTFAAAGRGYSAAGRCRTIRGACACLLGARSRSCAGIGSPAASLEKMASLAASRGSARPTALPMRRSLQRSISDSHIYTSWPASHS
jgi:hypothetical protein